MFRFILFVFGIVTGFVAALMILPLPGKTFFNRMSKLPSNAQDLIDNAINLGISIFRVSFTAGKEFNHRFRDIARHTRTRIEEINEEFAKEREANIVKKNGSPKPKQENKEEQAAV